MTARDRASVYEWFSGRESKRVDVASCVVCVCLKCLGVAVCAARKSLFSASYLMLRGGITESVTGQRLRAQVSRAEPYVRDCAECGRACVRACERARARH